MTGDWWLVTWGTYGSWLPGDPRGFKTWRKREYIPPVFGKAQPGEPVYDPAAFSQRHRRARDSCGDAVILCPQDVRLCCQAMVRDLSQISVAPAILSIAPTHCHLVAKFGALKIRSVVGRLKFAASREVHDSGSRMGRIWAKGCHMKSLPRPEAFDEAIRYVADHKSAGALVHQWPID